MITARRRQQLTDIAAVIGMVTLATVIAGGLVHVVIQAVVMVLR